MIDSGLDEDHEDHQVNRWLNRGEICNNGIDDDDNGYVDDCYGYNNADDTHVLLGDGDHGMHCAGELTPTREPTPASAPASAPARTFHPIGFHTAPTTHTTHHQARSERRMTTVSAWLAWQVASMVNRA